MERKPFGLPQSRFTKGNSETTRIVTPPSSHFLCEPPQQAAISGQSNETAALKKVEEYPFTPSIKSTNWRDDDMRSPITPAASPRVTSHPASLESSGEVKGLSIHRLRISAGLPSMYQGRFSSPASEFTPTPERKSTVAEISPGKSSSPIRLTGSSVKPFIMSSQIEKNHLSSEQQQLPKITEDKQFKNESGSSAGANDSEHSALYRFQLNETVDSQSSTEWLNSNESIQEEMLFESVCPSEDFKRASDLSCENETFRSHVKNLQEKVSAVEEQLEQKQGQCEMVNSQLKDKEQRLKEALEHILSLEELMRSKDGQLSALQNPLQQVQSEHKAAEHKVNAIREKNLSLERQLAFSAKEISTLRVEAQKQSNRNNELQVHLDDMEDLLLSDRTKLRAEIANLLKEKLEMEETAQRLERTARAQESNIEIVAENNLKLMKDKLEIEETVKRLEKTLSAYEEYIKIFHQTVGCTLVFTENLKAVNNASGLTLEINVFLEKLGILRQNAEGVDEVLKDLNFSFEKFTETKNPSLLNKDTDTRDSKTLANDEDGININEESPRSATRKAPKRSPAVAAKRLLSVQKEYEPSSSTSGNEPTEINNEAYAIRGRQKLVPSPPCNLPMLILEDCLRVRQNPKTARARKDEYQISEDDSFPATPFLSAKQNDAPERLSMNARTCQTNPNPVIPLSVPPAKKCRNK